jgi:hypothetical protein
MLSLYETLIEPLEYIVREETEHVNDSITVAIIDGSYMFNL